MKLKNPAISVLLLLLLVSFATEQQARAYTDPGNAASQKVLLHCGLKYVGEIDLLTPTHHGERRAPLFRISRPEF